MHTINLGNYPGSYDKATKTISMSEKGIPFATDYMVRNPKTGGELQFTFSHSTGSEWDPKTIFIWKIVNHENKPELDGLTLQLHNDAELTKQRGAAYLAAKTRRHA